ncbi:HNH endonuclease [Burkholderia pseudomallei]|uniref:HNH endonuclease n=1 Tax=Burkholderia pseudomallei TaxID=28450 RepID=UPI000572A326
MAEGMLEEFSYRCVKCGCTPDGRPCKDHVVPIAMEGSDAIENLQPLCRECNTSKGWDVFNWVQYRREHGFSQEGK